MEMDSLKDLDSSTYECVLYHACTRIWEGEKAFTWLNVIKDNQDRFTSSDDLSDRIYICLILGQLHFNLLYVEQGGQGFCNPDKFRDAFSSISQLFPFSNSETKIMKKKVFGWTEKEQVTVPECQEYIKELKEYFRPEFDKLKNDKLEEAYKVYCKKLKSNERKPNAGTLKNVFLMKYSGNVEDGLREWEQIKNDTHPDVIQLKRKLSRKLDVNKTKEKDVVSTLPGCSVQLQDIKTSTLYKKYIGKLGKVKESEQLQNKTICTACVANKLDELDQQIIDFSSNSVDELLANANFQAGFESSDDVIGPTPETDIPTLQKAKNNVKLTSLAKRQHGAPECSPHITEEDFDVDRTKNLTASKHQKLQRPVVSDDKTSNKPNIEECCSFRKTSQNIHVVSNNYKTPPGNFPTQVSVQLENVISPLHPASHNNSLEINVKEQRFVTKNNMSEINEHNVVNTEVQNIAENADAAAHNLAEASKHLMNVVNDPYKCNSDDSDRSDVLERKRKLSKWNAPQKTAAQLVWSSSDEDVDSDEQTKIGLPTPKVNKGLLQFVNDDVNDQAQQVARKQKKRKRYWSQDETSWIQEGARVYGKGNWAKILASFPFVNRTSVDIKDKYRNMVKKGELHEM